MLSRLQTHSLSRSVSLCLSAVFSLTAADYWSEQKLSAWLTKPDSGFLRETQFNFIQSCQPKTQSDLNGIVLTKMSSNVYKSCQSFTKEKPSKRPKNSLKTCFQALQHKFTWETIVFRSFCLGFHLDIQMNHFKGAFFENNNKYIWNKV